MAKTRKPLCLKYINVGCHLCSRLFSVQILIPFVRKILEKRKKTKTNTFMFVTINFYVQIIKLTIRLQQAYSFSSLAPLMLPGKYNVFLNFEVTKTYGLESKLSSKKKGCFAKILQCLLSVLLVKATVYDDICTTPIISERNLCMSKIFAYRILKRYIPEFIIHFLYLKSTILLQIVRICSRSMRFFFLQMNYS